MNAQRRKAIDSIIDRLTDLRSDLEQIMDEEIEARDNMPESERYYTMDEACDNLDSALNSIDEAIDYAESAKGE